MEQDKEFLEYVVRALVDNPSAVQVDRTVDEMGVLITLTVDPNDMGKIIGRQGNTAKAIRTLLRTIGMKNNARVNLKINEPEGGKKSMSHDETSSTPVAPKTPVQQPTQASSIEDAMEDLKGI
ncbi:MAG: KH domain-containing protein [Candidatus Pacebacteria bacterium]|nr:KH domain-containing protein [Candidatus Paceibacterota bacterium]